jgi:hypothetical protein
MWRGGRSCWLLPSQLKTEKRLGIFVKWLARPVFLGLRKMLPPKPRLWVSRDCRLLSHQGTVQQAAKRSNEQDHRSSQGADEQVGTDKRIC